LLVELSLYRYDKEDRETGLKQTKAYVARNLLYSRKLKEEEYDAPHHQHQASKSIRKE